eukprot:TRINITY_DN4380_c0_g1_i1.p1 TRINITY_DN4380_c0_g1~~TRINITY_DN4380_c0_g1_i1.p1  ORF type:complete len:289 (-),score=85.26 TRINITY_DN4380_c0_g1_i1:163-1029(-)
MAILRHPHEASLSTTDSTLNRTSSLPNLLNDDSGSSSEEKNSSIESPHTPYVPPPPPKPPRYIYKSASRDSVFVLSSPPNETISPESGVPPPYMDISTVPPSTKSLRVMPPSYRLSSRFRRQNSRMRRHSVSSLLESDVMGNIKRWENERRLLEEGLRTLEVVGDNIQERLENINQRLQNPYKNQEMEDGSKAPFLPKRLAELNEALSRLNSPPTEEENSKEDLHRQIERLKEQNRLLTQEVSSKSSLISSMEREKGSVIKELFQARSLVGQLSKKSTEAEDSIMTFI